MKRVDWKLKIKSWKFLWKVCVSKLNSERFVSVHYSSPHNRRNSKTPQFREQAKWRHQNRRSREENLEFLKSELTKPQMSKAIRFPKSSPSIIQNPPQFHVRLISLFMDSKWTDFVHFNNNFQISSQEWQLFIKNPKLSLLRWLAHLQDLKSRKTKELEERASRQRSLARKRSRGPSQRPNQ